MKSKPKRCDGCEADRPIWKNHGGKKYCKQCWSCHPDNVKPKPKARSYRIPPRSVKRTKEEKKYSKLRKEFLTKHPMCQMRIPGKCTQHATDVHHKAGRVGSNYLDVTKWLPGCRACHDWVHAHPREARELGLME